MNHKVTLSKCLNYIIITVIGEVNRKSAKKHNTEAYALGKEMGINKYLIDVTSAVNTDTILNNYNSVHKDKMKLQNDEHTRVAILVSTGDQSHNFIETVSRNAGLLTRLFTCSELATEYLLK